MKTTDDLKASEAPTPKNTDTNIQAYLNLMITKPYIAVKHYACIIRDIYSLSQYLKELEPSHPASQEYQRIFAGYVKQTDSLNKHIGHYALFLRALMIYQRHPRNVNLTTMSRYAKNFLSLKIDCIASCGPELDVRFDYFTASVNVNKVTALEEIKTWLDTPVERPAVYHVLLEMLSVLLPKIHSTMIQTETAQTYVHVLQKAISLLKSGEPYISTEKYMCYMNTLTNLCNEAGISTQTQQSIASSPIPFTLKPSDPKPGSLFDALSKCMPKSPYADSQYLQTFILLRMHEASTTSNPNDEVILNYPKGHDGKQDIMHLPCTHELAATAKAFKRNIYILDTKAKTYVCYSSEEDNRSDAISISFDSEKLTFTPNSSNDVSTYTRVTPAGTQTHTCKPFQINQVTNGIPVHTQQQLSRKRQHPGSG